MANFDHLRKDIKKLVCDTLGIDELDFTRNEVEIINLLGDIVISKVEEINDLEKTIYGLEIDIKNKKIIIDSYIEDEKDE